MKRIVLGLVLVMSVSSVALGQGCSVCTKTAQGLDDKSAKGLNRGILYLALLPLAIIGTVGGIWWKSKNSE
ncbi:MAG: hypothetical protein K9G49_12015 [Taibaiella sp.]|nr:hypothetical protein [Taibaiella sp.]